MYSIIIQSSEPLRYEPVYLVMKGESHLESTEISCWMSSTASSAVSRLITLMATISPVFLVNLGERRSKRVSQGS